MLVKRMGLTLGQHLASSRAASMRDGGMPISMITTSGESFSAWLMASRPSEAVPRLPVNLRVSSKDLMPCLN